MISLVRARSAVLAMDFQTTIVDMLGDDAKPTLERAAAVVRAARAAGVLIVHVVVGFRPGYPEANPRIERFAQIMKAGRFQTETPGSDIDATLAREPTEPVVMKHRVGAFFGTDLDMILRSRSIDTIVLAGVATSGVVLSTTRYAADADYRAVIVKDACADRDPEVHRVLVEKIFPNQATVITTEEAVAALGHAAAPG